MTDKKEIQCEYCTVRSNENKCKALEIEFHNCLNILEQKKCPIYKLKQQLQEKEKECEELKREIAFGNNGKLSDKIRAIVFKNLNAENSKYKQALEPFKDDYFKNLDTKTIAELAKKSIRLTTENRELEQKNEELKAQVDEWKENCNNNFELVAIRTKLLTDIAIKLGLNTVIIEHKDVFDKIDKLQSKEQLSVKQSHELIRLRKELQ